ncbi:Phosphoglyceromutase [Serratia rubidaea]|uniref:Phosphoglyceromutase n=1 Tax=Serratia rubidaea TaxID=61652 RepID=A0A4U9H9T7_SERRU|nr:histidine phosphatase family protein [Serratia rubidaea]MBS0974069.1 histidine phosphatase family protein [Serratia rubidaea]MDC6108484.1 histidine phosphatase family protein [Serratia rubidaea]QPR65097.1 histidine phosphatase family protein [Serratia rubidaea]UJD78280.1 histidine phosphatase family protein [Serratia rubidaea]UJD82831.1 histidine phosphatase family protein [Serratia rubidaea]
MRFIVIRHAESQGNREGIIQGQHDSPVTADGYRQIAALMAALKDTTLTQIFSSPSGRAMTTAQALAAHCKCVVRSDERLYEQHFGCYQGQSYHQAISSNPGGFARIFAGEPTATAPQGESALQVVQRLMSFFRSFPAGSCGTAGVVTHGHAIQALIWQLQGANPGEETSKYSHLSGSYSIIDAGNQGLTLQHWGIASHLRALRRSPI